ncbi:MAG TPA: VOC family protein [Stellaceae bacterium]|nr:VOC family protein [Stellaceae bacterium]
MTFNGRCEEAIEFYKKALGAEVQMMLRFKQAPDQSMIQPGMDEKIMHATLQIGDGVVLASDGMCTGGKDFQNFALSFTVRDEVDAARRFNALAEDGQVRMPLGKTFFSPAFGMLQDKFGVGWMIYVEPKA